MPRRDGRRNRGTDSRPIRHKENQLDVDEDSPVIKLFRSYQHQLDKKHDKYERVVKLSRDITIESKRIIFLLHRISGDGTQDTILTDAENKLKALREEKWQPLAEELLTEDHHQYLRAYTAGLQEYIEAISFWQFLKEKTLISVEQVEEGLRFSHQPSTQEESTRAPTERDDSTVLDVAVSSLEDDANKSNVSKSQPANTYSMYVHVPPTHYLLGIADLTGELMRMAIHSIGEGDFDLPFEHCNFMRLIHDAFISFGSVDRELSRKVHVLRQSLQKVETACYTLEVRGSEIPKHMLAEAFSKSTADDLLSEEMPSGASLGF